MGMGERIKEMRKAKGLTQEELAQRLGLKDSAIAKYENGRVENIKRSTIAEMAKILECSPVYLLCLDEESPAPSDFSISDLEKQIIVEFRKADFLDQQMVLRILKLEEKGDGAAVLA